MTGYRHTYAWTQWLSSVYTSVYNQPTLCTFEGLYLVQQLSSELKLRYDAVPIEVSVMSECTPLLGWKLDFEGVLDSGFSSCAVPTYYCGSEYFLFSVHKFRT